MLPPTVDVMSHSVHRTVAAEDTRGTSWSYMVRMRKGEGGREGRERGETVLGLDTASSSPSQGVVMALVFVFVLPTGALVSRYYKAVFSAWFKVCTRHVPRLLVGGMGMRLPVHWTNSGPPSPPPLPFSPFPVPPSSLLPSSHLPGSCNSNVDRRGLGGHWISTHTHPYWWNVHSGECV